MKDVLTLLLVASIGFLSLDANSNAAEFKQVKWNGHQVLLLTGDIIPGDAIRFGEAVAKIKPLSHGFTVVLLSSSGGSVEEAFRISEVFSRARIHTVVPSGGRCASACASIIFVAGEYRTVDEGGLLGQHSCSLFGKKNQECNDLISQHAVANGVSYGSIGAFITYAEPHEMIWFDRLDADCYGITRYPFTIESGFDAKSEPCVIKSLTGKWPKAQSSWRIDFKADGYRAFLRPAADHERELELSLFCSEAAPGILFLSMDIGGPSSTIRDSIIRASLLASPLSYLNVPFLVSQVDLKYSQVAIQIKRDDVIKLLTQTDKISFTLELKKPYQPIGAYTFLSASRKALVFAANNCIDAKGS